MGGGTSPWGAATPGRGYEASIELALRARQGRRVRLDERPDVAYWRAGQVVGLARARLGGAALEARHVGPVAAGSPAPRARAGRRPGGTGPSGRAPRLLEPPV